MPETSLMVDFTALEHNVREIRRILGGTEIMAVLKGNAYGLGARHVMLELLDLGVKNFAAANFHEAMDLRFTDCEASVMILGYVDPENMAEAARNGLSFTVFSRDYWALLQSRVDQPFGAHIKVDTGFNRLGFELCGDDCDCV